MIFIYMYIYIFFFKSRVWNLIMDQHTNATRTEPEILGYLCPVCNKGFLSIKTFKTHQTRAAETRGADIRCKTVVPPERTVKLKKTSAANNSTYIRMTEEDVSDPVHSVAPPWTSASLELPDVDISGTKQASSLDNSEHADLASVFSRYMVATSCCVVQQSLRGKDVASHNPKVLLFATTCMDYAKSVFSDPSSRLIATGYAEGENVKLFVADATTDFRKEVLVAILLFFSSYATSSCSGFVQERETPSPGIQGCCFCYPVNYSLLYF